MILINTSRKNLVALGLTLVCIASASAQVSTSKLADGSIVTKASSVVQKSRASLEAPAGATLIYSNFNLKGGAPYNELTGWTEAGAQANDYPLAEAMSFVPANDFVVSRIDAALTWVTGTNGAHLILAEDNGGVPGQIIYAASFTNLPVFGTCCTVQTAKLSPTKTSHVGLKGGSTYWLYVLPDDPTGYIVWNYGLTNVGGNGAVSENYGATWTPTVYQVFGAFDLYGIQVAQ